MTRVRWILLVAAAALALAPLGGSRFWLQFLASAMITALFAMSLDLLVGSTGLVSLAHAAFFGLGSYLLAGLTNGLGYTQLVLTLPLCLAGVALAALAVGWLSLRTSGVYFIMVTLAFTQMLHYLFSDSNRFGGSDGLYLTDRPRLFATIELGNRTASYYAVWIAMLFTYLFLSRLLRAPFGRVLIGIRGNEQRMRTLGFATGRYKLVAFVIAGVLAGLAGYLDASLTGFITPAHLGWRASGLLLMTVLLGGKGTLYGPALGALCLSLFEYQGERLTTHWQALVGLALIAVVLYLPRGIAGLLTPARPPHG